jgi:hypothetical protein
MKLAGGAEIVAVKSLKFLPKSVKVGVGESASAADVVWVIVK